MAHDKLYLFGGKEAWNPADWTASDDRVRGGKSQSYVECSSSDSVARFHGTLDIKTLGGAGFASQRTTGEDRVWNIDGYDGIQFEITKSDAKKYTFNLKDTLLEKNPENGREQATISYEYDFTASTQAAEDKPVSVFIPWKDLKATYRGKEKKDAPPPNLKNVKRLSIMMRSFFGDQEGPFSLSIRSISTVTQKKDEKQDASTSPYATSGDLEKGTLPTDAQNIQAANQQRSGSFLAPRMARLARAFHVAAAIMLFVWLLKPMSS
ncbi:uncharacterized protein K452DRAFT_315687 [Aplosporella prunicola CBS 121167]|uniref:NADH:ubiquinone oxidoreductase intermediate-associated protein 30 domain-containing protein n=1 Tax=Aplosporella prunicola CBS 121167 TaxID=1176127 RepID=A0A6A6BS85_9PEZI|nr:uncharacterized protein K452DRAFT_315687 [Aplosporella prunicola CBS 121167]KAF2145441.1 hypothetical protein K452DRAFT_315687 [Aplosporella prunicola CBS 121167]